jgi:uncharacterized cupin superfamily protein
MAVVPEAPLRETKYGLVTDGDGWFVINARDSRWRNTGPFGMFCDFEGKKRFPHFGINLSVLEPGQPMSLYHREKAQEAFLILAGKCLLIVEDEERELRAWDFVHCPPETEHIIVGAGEEPSVVLAVGARGLARKGIVYVASKTARKHGAGVKKETAKAGEAYAGFPAWKRIAYQEGWLPDR